MRRDDRQRELAGEPHGRGDERVVVGDAPRAAPRGSSGPGSDAAHARAAFAAPWALPCSSAAPTSPSRAPESAISPSVPSSNHSRLQLRAAAVLVAAVGARQPVGELQVAGARLREQQRAERLVALGLVREPDVAAEDRLDAARARRLVELDEAERVGEIGDRQRRHGVRRRRRDRRRRCAPCRRRSSTRCAGAGGRRRVRSWTRRARVLEFYPDHRPPFPSLNSSPVRRVVRASCLRATLAARARVGARAAARTTATGTDRRSAGPAAAGRSRSRRRPHVNLSGFPLPYRQGYADGCASATGPERKDATRFAADGNYRTGWQDGLALCRKK